MLWELIQIILATVLVVKLVKYLIPDGPAPIFGVYMQPNAYYPIKFALAFLGLSLRKYQNDRKSAARVSVRDPGYGTRSRSTVDEMDQAQPLGTGDPEAVDAVYFVGANRSGTYLVAATARRPQHVINGFWYLRIPGVGLLKSPKLPDTTLRTDHDLQFSTTDGLLIEPVEPMRRWKITYDGMMKFEGRDAAPVHVRIDLEWKSDLRHFNFDTDVPPVAMARALAKESWTRAYFEKLKMAHQTHHEQMGFLTGTVAVDGHGVHKLELNSMRDHSYARKRDWKLLHRYGLHSVYLEDGTMFSVGIICQPGILSWFEMGYVYTPSGDLHGVDWCDLALHRHGEGGTPPLDYSFAFKAGGQTYVVECKVIESPELYMGQDWEARVIERMCTYRVNGKEGWGFAEWEYRNLKGKLKA